MGVCGEVMSLVIYLHYGGWGPGDDSDRPAPQACAWIFVLQTVLISAVIPFFLIDCFFFLPLPPARDEVAITGAHSGGQWRGAEVEPDRGAGPGDTMLLLPQNRQRAQEGERGLGVPQNLWELPTQWSLWDQVRQLTTEKRNGCDVSFMNLVLKTTVFKVKAFRFPFSRSWCSKLSSVQLWVELPKQQIKVASCCVLQLDQ